MNKLEPTEIAAFLQRFGGFEDGAVLKIEVVYRSFAGRKRDPGVEPTDRDVSVWLTTMDHKDGHSDQQKDPWVCVRLTLPDCQCYRFANGFQNSMAVQIYGLHVVRFGDVVGIDLGSQYDPPATLAELKASPCFAAGAQIEWSLEPYVRT